jgi:hypothetical protein
MSRFPVNGAWSRANLWAYLHSLFDNQDFLSGVIGPGKAWYVDANNGSDGNNDGQSWGSAFATMTPLDTLLGNYDVVYLAGVLRQQWTAPQDVFDVSIIGVENRPRQATDGGVATGGGASWLAPTSPTATTPLLTLREQGWTIANIQFAPVASSACIRLSRAETATDMDGSHATISGCYFTLGGTGSIGIEDVGGTGHNLIDGCRFENLDDTGIKGISTGIAVPLQWVIQNCMFKGGTNDIKMSLSYSVIEKNNFLTAGSGSTNKVVSTVAVSAQGDHNIIRLNQFVNTSGQIQISNGYSGSATDTWSNYCNGTAALIVTSPPGA